MRIELLDGEQFMERVCEGYRLWFTCRRTKKTTTTKTSATNSVKHTSSVEVITEQNKKKKEMK